MRNARKNCWFWCLALGLLISASGCHRYLVATPNIMRHQDAKQIYAACPADCQTSEAAVLYATDRNIIDNSKATPTYGHGRETTLAFGVAKVSLDPNPSWKELVENSTVAKRSRAYELKLASVHPAGRFDDAIQPSAIAQANVKAGGGEVNRLHELLRGRLAQTTHKDVLIFIHGYNNSFDDSVFRAAEVWHFMGRVGVPVAYSWPAGYGGVRGYAYDRESGEYTVTHLRRFIQAVADCPDVERVHLVAHSRGCDLAVTALRELNLELTAQRKSTQQELKLENLVLAAPDLDEGIFAQRVIAENLLQAARRTTIYFSPNDRPIQAAAVLFASHRLGNLGAKELSPELKATLGKMPNVQFIECKVSGFSRCHNYAFTHPAALSDLILVLRDRREPGLAHGRPLRPLAEGTWELPEDYLARTK